MENHLETYSSICHQSQGVSTRAQQLPVFASAIKETVKSGH